MQWKHTSNGIKCDATNLCMNYYTWLCVRVCVCVRLVHYGSKENAATLPEHGFFFTFSVIVVACGSVRGAAEKHKREP